MSLIMMTVGTFYYFESFWWKEKIVFLYIENAFMTFFLVQIFFKALAKDLLHLSPTGGGED